VQLGAAGSSRDVILWDAISRDVILWDAISRDVILWDAISRAVDEQQSVPDM
jgi:hypothetical protein